MADSVQPRRAFGAALRAALTVWGRTATDADVDLLSLHYELMIEANRAMNLTRITEPVAAAVKHYADSLALSTWSQGVGFSHGTVLDVGTGAGFPAVPLAVMQPTWKICAIDGTRKKIDFLTRAVAEMRLPNLEVLHAHADHWGTARRFDVVCTRAVASIAKSLPFAARLSAPRGWFVAFKTPSSEEQERGDADRVGDTCKMIREPSFDYELAIADERLKRRLAVFRRGA